MMQAARWLDAQNSDVALTYRAASDSYWCDVQRLRAFELFLVVLVPAVLAVIAQFHAAIVTAAGLAALILTVLDTSIIYPLIATFRSKAASAQDAFDAVAYALPSPPVPYFDEEDRGEIHTAARRQSPKRAKRNRDWYSPELGALPIRFGRIACLREAVAWDGGLRWRYVVALGAIIVLAAATIIVYAVVASMSASDIVIRVLYALTPAIVWIGREIWDQRDSAGRADALRKHVEGTWQRALKGEATTRDLEGIASAHQWHVFAYRERTAPVPSVFYSLLRNSQETSASDAAKDAVGEYRSSVEGGHVHAERRIR